MTLRAAAEQLRKQLATTYPREDVDLDAVRALVDAALAAEQPQPEALSGWRMVPVEPTAGMLAAGVAAESNASTHVQERLTLLAYRAMLAAAPPPAAPEPSEAEVAAAMASLYRAMEPAAWPSEDEVTDALRAAAAARNTNPA